MEKQLKQFYKFLEVDKKVSKHTSIIQKRFKAIFRISR